MPTLASEDIDGNVLTTHYETLNRGYSSPNLTSLDLDEARILNDACGVPLPGDPVAAVGIRCRLDVYAT